MPPITPPSPPILAAGTHTLAKSAPWQLTTLTKAAISRLPDSLRWPVPCARSYEGYDWEPVLPRAAGASLVRVVLCDATSCDLAIPEDAEYTYFLQTVDVSAQYVGLSPAQWYDRAAAAFLTQASFGPTRATLRNLSDALQAGSPAASLQADAVPPPAPAAMAQWVVEQIATPPTLHRAYLRKRAHPRAYLRQVTAAGRARSACEAGARWSRLAIRADDITSTLAINTSLAGGTELFIDGVLRSEIATTEVRPWGLTEVRSSKTGGALVLGATYTICDVDEWQQGKVLVGSACTDSGASLPVELLNVFIAFTTAAPPTSDQAGEPMVTWEVPSGAATWTALQPASVWNEGVIILAELHMACPLPLEARVVASTVLKLGAQDDATYYRYDPRLVLSDNTVDRPLDLSQRDASNGHGAPTGFMCPAAAKTFLNEDECVMTRGCLPYAYTNTSFELNASSLRAMYTHGRTLAYALDGLALHMSGLEHDPCNVNKITRWRALGGACSGDVGGMDEGSRAVLIALLRSGADRNPFVRDIQLPSGQRDQCTQSAANFGTKLSVDGECWQHTNPRQLNVYDFTIFAFSVEHPGNDELRGFRPIAQLAKRGGTTMMLTSAHDTRVRVGHIDQSSLQLIGKLGDTVTWESLPMSVKTLGFAAWLGVEVTDDQQSVPAAEACGSPGEVASDPALGAHFYFINERYMHNVPHSQHEMLSNHRQTSVLSTQKQIHLMAALHGADELRQRVAWALSQVLVLGEGAGKLQSSAREMWVTFYDIFVRHAFGSYRSILKEVSFSPLMVTDAGLDPDCA